MEQYASVQQLLKKEEEKDEKLPIYPPTVIQAVHDAKTGAPLESILAQYNSVYIQYQGNPKDTRNIIPQAMRRAGLTITYMNMNSETIKERANSSAQMDNDHWGLDTNWSRIDELSLSGDISVSVNGTWIINGEDTGIKAVGPKGDSGITPWLKTIDNKLHYSYDNITWEECSENIAAWFRWKDNKIQISRDNKNWVDLTGKFTDNFAVKGYVASYDLLPTSASQGDIYGIGPTYAESDTEHTNPIYRYYVRNANSWVDNGSFNSISAGVVQETGNSETEVMSQKATTEKLTELATQVIYDVSANNDGATFPSLSALLSSENLSTLIPIAVRCGGMSIRFAQTSDNKYVQAICAAQTFTTDVTQWQGVDEEPTVESENLVKSGGVAKQLIHISGYNENIPIKENTGYYYNGASVGNQWDDSYKKASDSSSVYMEYDLSNLVGGTITLKTINPDSQSGRQIVVVVNGEIVLAGYEASFSSGIEFNVVEGAVLYESHKATTTFQMSYQEQGQIPLINKKVEEVQILTLPLKLYWHYGYIATNGTIGGTAGTDRQYSDYFLVAGGITIKYIAETNHPSIAGISFYDKSGSFISGVANNGSLGEEQTVTSPNNAVFARLSTKTAIIETSNAKVYGSSGNAINDIAKNGEIIRFISPSGNDNNNGLTPSTAFKTLNKAIEQKATRVYLKAGIYNSEKISVEDVENLEIIVLSEAPSSSDKHKPKAVFDNGIGMSFEYDSQLGLRKATFHTDDTSSHWYRVFVSQDLSPEQPGGQSTIYNVVLWKCIDGINDKKLKPVLSLALCQSTNDSFFYDHDNSIVYLNTNTIGASYYRLRYEEGVNYKFKNIANLKISDVSFVRNVQWVLLENVYDATIKECLFSHCANNNGLELQRSNVDVYESEAFKNTADGFGIALQGQCNFYNCRGHHNYDDGISHHDGATGQIIGGIYKNNGKGGIISQYTGARVDISGAVCFDNMYGIYAGTGEDECIISNCVLKGNTVGLQNQGYTLHCFNNIIEGNTTNIAGEGNTIIY